jgi:sugar phosphate isomerase/epimerase
LTLAAGDLVLCAGTLESTPLLERLAPARAAGFDGVSVFTSDVSTALQAGHSARELRKRIEGEGLAIGEFDPIAKWFPSAMDGGGLLAMDADDALRHAETLGARSVTAVVFPATPPSRDELVENFANLCERGTNVGVQVHIEFIPFTPVANLADAIDLVEAAGHPNGGVMLDVWHLFRSGGSAADIAAVAPRIYGVQLDDAPTEPAENLMFETTTARLLPGEGDAGVADILRALREGGSPAPLGVEVFAESLKQQPAAAVARQAYEATQSCIEASR